MLIIFEYNLIYFSIAKSVTVNCIILSIISNLFHLYVLPLEPNPPWDFKATNYGETEVSLEWKEPRVTAKEVLDYMVRKT